MAADVHAERMLNHRTQAVLGAGDLEFGVSVMSLRHVLPRPERLARLPRAGRNLAGVLSFRGHVVPVVDLNCWQTGVSASVDAYTHVAILAVGERVLGVLINSVKGLVHVQVDQVRQVHHDQDPNEFFHSVVPLEGEGALLSLLDPVRLMLQAQVWAAKNACESASIADLSAMPEGDSSVSLTDPYAVLRVGNGWFGLPACSVAEVLPRPALQTVWAQGGDLVGILRWRGIDVPLVHPSAQLGQEPSQDAEKWVVVLHSTPAGSEAGPITIALPCHEMDQVRRFSVKQLQLRADAPTLCAPSCKAALLLDDGRRIQLMDADLIAQHAGLRLSASGDERADARPKEKEVRNAVAHVVFHARTRMAVPIDQLQEIMSVPADFSFVTSQLPDCRVGTVVWREKLIPVVDLQQRLCPGLAATTQHKRILVTWLNGELMGLLVGEVDVLIPPYSGVITNLRLPDGQVIHMITLAQANEKISYRLVDFSTLALAA